MPHAAALAVISRPPPPHGIRAPHLLFPVPRLSIINTSNVLFSPASPATSGAAMEASAHDATPDPPGSIHSRSPRPGAPTYVRRTNTVALPAAGLL